MPGVAAGVVPGCDAGESNTEKLGGEHGTE